MEGSQTILDPPEIQAGSGKATEKKPMVFSFGRHLEHLLGVIVK